MLFGIVSNELYWSKFGIFNCSLRFLIGEIKIVFDIRVKVSSRLIMPAKCNRNVKNLLIYSKKGWTFALVFNILAVHKVWRDGRVVECDGLENR